MKITKNRLMTGMAALLLVGGGIYWYWWSQHHHDGWAQTTSKATSAQNDYEGDGRHTNDGQGATPSQGGAIDNNGDRSGSATEKGMTSQSGLLTVVGPVANQRLANGSMIRGRASDLIERVQYRVVDDNVGVIAQGSLNVVDGSYSGTMQFVSKAKTGRVDIFTYNSSYNEENSIQIPVNF